MDTKKSQQTNVSKPSTKSVDMKKVEEIGARMPAPPPKEKLKIKFIILYLIGFFLIAGALLYAFMQTNAFETISFKQIWPSIPLMLFGSASFIIFFFNLEHLQKPAFLILAGILLPYSAILNLVFQKDTFIMQERIIVSTVFIVIGIFCIAVFMIGWGGRFRAAVTLVSGMVFACAGLVSFILHTDAPDVSEFVMITSTVTFLAGVSLIGVFFHKWGSL